MCLLNKRYILKYNNINQSANTKNVKILCYCSKLVYWIQLVLPKAIDILDVNLYVDRNSIFIYIVITK